LSLQLSDRVIERVHLIDDDPHVRHGYRYSVEDLELNADEVTGPIGSFDELLRSFDTTRDAAICDFQLTTKNYSNHNGDELVSRLYSRNIPAVLCTRWAGHLPDQVRYRRRSIPVVLNPSELSSDSIAEAFNTCTKEFAGNFADSRRPWRTLIRVESCERAGTTQLRLNVIIPAWDPQVGLTFVVPATDSDAIRHISERIGDGDVIRAFGQVNLGAETPDDLYIDQWTLQ
jgi:hypothetical protein